MSTCQSRSPSYGSPNKSDGRLIATGDGPGFVLAARRSRRLAARRSRRSLFWKALLLLRITQNGRRLTPYGVHGGRTYSSADRETAIKAGQPAGPQWARRACQCPVGFFSQSTFVGRSSSMRRTGPLAGLSSRLPAARARHARTRRRPQRLPLLPVAPDVHRHAARGKKNNPGKSDSESVAGCLSKLPPTSKGAAGSQSIMAYDDHDRNERVHWNTHTQATVVYSFGEPHRGSAVCRFGLF